MLTGNEDNKLRFGFALWSPAEERISYIYRKQLECNNVRRGINVLSNGKEKKIESDSLVRLLGWLPNETEVLTALGTGTQVKMIRISISGAAKPLTTANLEGVDLDGMTLSPDGEKIAYAESTGGNQSRCSDASRKYEGSAVRYKRREIIH